MSDKPLPSSFDSDPEFFEENPWVKLRRRLREEPLIPLGCAATSYALWRAYKSMKAGDSDQLNRMFRYRIYAQAFTLVAVVVGGIYYKSERAQRKELERAMEEKKSQAKRDAWLRELEIRDQEDRDWRERHAAVERAAKEAGMKPKDVSKGLAGESAGNQEGEAKSNVGVLDAVKNLVKEK
ncbi:Hypoxia induced family protein [Coccidioides posadasii C735 delta SOWgp]|uniref:Respiratory supercomplex factor 1, mitochondrial n=2 Tax=Coccidioides posadasii TaxID=199306 RepID=RCF1_COCP7|nr:Hypoxia induced family protein [Coccidioides posadasii C735 delta SOWgp]C5P447.1 RecName: Full=Respiratory supercomplex factor 1, mitochondrial [Coccidioides posadasii C735 delta SOWgp]EER28465.1 Hypoxia induced family protein [Coccidioides posadasii C735 delta SOWgp]KMM68541.1 mitochondrial hypoxia responsive domain-containing protein [Coccidioides posadasii RMSCC 3488]|eukprot:XP_003070610.1 Hypoxia induced family protein [Coccidioides posadasii C735 delta SOWgp]